MVSTQVLLKKVSLGVLYFVSVIQIAFLEDPVQRLIKASARVCGCKMGTQVFLG